MNCFQLLALVVLLNLACGLEDDLKFEISWLGSTDEAFKNINPGNILDMKTIYNENFKCIIPDIKNPDDNKKAGTDIYMPVSNIIEPLYTKKICSYRIESYWIYELCHGQYIRQYHETKQSGKRVVPEEYFLGYYDPKIQEKEYYEENGIKKTHIQWKMFEGKRTPMFSVKYNQGTNCAIVNNIPRETTVFYTCDENGNENVVSFEEISSCNYEMIVTSKSLCNHPAFQVSKLTQDKIECYADDNSPIKPFELISMEQETAEARDNNNKITMTNQDGSIFVLRYRTTDDQDEQEYQDDPSLNTNRNVPNKDAQQEAKQQFESQQHAAGHVGTTNADKEVINSFLSGSTCLNGGTGWWKYEVCLGKHVIQYHEEDINSPRTVIVLGKWDKDRHLNWLEVNPSKKPQKRSEKMQLSLLYVDGDVCDSTHRPRSAEVKLKCDKTRKTSGVALYLLEPIVCEYVIAIESPVLCSAIENSSENGLLSDAENTP